MDHAVIHVTAMDTSVGSHSADQCRRQIGQTNNLQYVSVVVSVISCLSSLFIFVGCVLYRRELKRSHRMRLLLYMNIVGFIFSLFLGIEAALLSAPRRIWYDYPLCQIQAFISNSAALSLNCWSLALTLYLYFGVMGHASFTDLQRRYSRIEYTFLFLCIIVIPLPFFIMIFPMPVAGSNPLRYVLLYNHSDKQWCDFANVRRPDDSVKQSMTNMNTVTMMGTTMMNSVLGNGFNQTLASNGAMTMVTSHSPFRNSTDTPDRVEYSWAIWWEIGFFYVPNTVMFLISLLLYIRVMFKIRTNSKQLEQRRALQQLSSSNQSTPTTPTDGVDGGGDGVGSVQQSSDAMSRNRPVASLSPSPPLLSTASPSLSSSLSRLKGNAQNSTPTNRLKSLSCSSDSISSSPVISSTTPVEYYGTNNQQPNLDPNMQLMLQPFHFRLSRITLNDIEEYTKFLQSQTRIASTYIGVLMVNWITWIIARVLWEFGECNLKSQGSRIFFISLLVFLQCTGPRIECILLSIIYGIAENTVSPNTLRDVFVDLTMLRYFKEFCANKTNLVIKQTDLSLTGYSSSEQQVEYEFDYDDLLFFWYDVQKMRMAVEKRKVLIEEYRKAVKQQGSGNESTTSPEQLMKQIDTCKRQTIEMARELCSTYFSESAPMPIHRSGIITNIQRNRIRTIVLQEVYMSEDEDYRSEESESDDTSVGVPSAVDSSDSDGESAASPPIKTPFNPIIYANSNNYSSISGNSVSSSHAVVDDEVAKQLNKDLKLLAMFSEPQRVAFQKLNQLMNQFQSSLLFQELIHVLRMKAVSKSRSLYKDILNRAVSKTFTFLRRGYHTIKNTVQKCLHLRNRKRRSVDPDLYEYEDYDEHDRLLGNRSSNVFKMSSDAVDDHHNSTLRIDDVEIFNYIREQKRAKTRRKQQTSAFTAF